MGDRADELVDAAGQAMGVLDTDKRVSSLAFVLLDGRDAEVGALARYGIRHGVMRLDEDAPEDLRAAFLAAALDISRVQLLE
ncbi:hypothetical protein [Actinomadura sp. SCN-SB]|uniref:hypothetical protein n=1 Tax=Actinomadura sp. SCN-SB TaxID=3373092 RepID=UPI003750732D